MGLPLTNTGRCCARKINDGRNECRHSPNRQCRHQSYLMVVEKGSAATSGRGVVLMGTTPGPEVPVLPKTCSFDALLHSGQSAPHLLEREPALNDELGRAAAEFAIGE